MKLQIEGWEGFSDKVAARIQANDYPDILNDNAFAASAEAGILYPIDEVVSAETLAAIDPSLLANGQSADGKQWAAPDIASARMMAYNVDLFDKAGIAAAPKSWAELEEASAKLAALGGDVKAYGMPLGNEEAQVESSLWLWGAGGSWIVDGELKADTPEAVEGFTQMKKMFEAGYTQQAVTVSPPVSPTSSSPSTTRTPSGSRPPGPSSTCCTRTPCTSLGTRAPSCCR